MLFLSGEADPFAKIALLRAAVDHARSQGARLLEAYPVDRDEPSHPDDMFFGAKSMYDRAGFKEVARRKPGRPIVRRKVEGGRAGSRSEPRGES